MVNDIETRGAESVIFIESYDGTKMETIVDTEELEELKKVIAVVIEFCGYAMAIKRNGVRHNLHRLIMKTTRGYYVDHINRNPLDNRKENMRHVTAAHNSQNRGAQKNSKSGVRGVVWSESRKVWRASACINKKSKYLGAFKTIEEADRCVKEFRQKHMPYSNE